jgi:RHS repeat-associated protein
VEPNSSLLKVTTNFAFDACGNTNSVSVVGLDQNGVAMPARTTGTSYGTRCQLPESVTNALTQTTYTGYNYSFGLPSSTTDPNGITVSWLYDDFGRKKQETRPDGTYTTYAFNDCVSSSCWGVADLRFLATTALYNPSNTLVRQEQKFYDGLDHLRYDEMNRVLGTWTNEECTYDGLGRKAYCYLPFSTSGNGYHNYTFDVANRMTQDALYNSSGALYRTISMGYAGQTATVTDPNSNTITKVSDVAGKIRQVTDPSTNGTVAGTTSYTFDPFGNLIKIVDADNFPSTYSYNIRGFKTASADADTGSWTFTPDSLNELVSQLDANGQTISFGYDLLGRMISRVEPEQYPNPTQWVYGTSAAAYNIGRIVQVTKPGTPTYAENYAYDNVGRPQAVTYTENGTNYAFTYAYNNLGTIDTLTYPVSTSGYQFVLKNVYDAYGFLNQVKDNAAGTVFWSLNSANDSSLPTLETLGNGAQVATSYTPWTNEMITRTEGSSGSTTNLQNLTYNWDLAGNLHQRIDNRQTLTEQFGYDSMNRLLNSTLNGTNNLTMTYDAAGNINSKSDVSASTYVYDTVHKHAVKTAGSWSMTYDANGNMITRAGGSITWKSYNLPATINYNSNSTTFQYNANHQRWMQVANYAGTTETTYYIGGLLEVMTLGSNPTEYRHQIPAGSSLAVYTRRTDGSTGTYYATSDHLGSSDLVMDSAANVLTRESFTPFGARRGSSWTGVPTTGDYTAFGNSTRKGFTGQEMLDSVSLVHMNGRVYDPYLGRFLSADMVIQTLGATESINPYAYAWNDPLKYVDPSGHSLIGDILGIIAAIAVVVLTDGAGLAAVYGQTIADIYTASLAGFVGGFVGAAVSTGSLDAAVTAGMVGALTAVAFYGAGTFASWAAKPSGAWLYADGILAHAAVGCASAAASGGNCGAGALSAAVSEAAEPMEDSAAQWGGPAAGAAAAGIVGGIAARVVNGSFNDGFSVGAAGYLFNNLLHQKYSRPELSISGNILTGTVYVSCRGADAQCSAIMSDLNGINGTGADGYGINIKFVQTSGNPFSAGFWHSANLSITVKDYLATQDGELGVTYGPTLRNIDLDSRFTEHVVDHEFGHFLGLEDQYTNPADLMYGFGGTGPTFPSQSDLIGLVKRYSGQ